MSVLPDDPGAPLTSATGSPPATAASPLLQVESLVQTYRVRSRGRGSWISFEAVAGVSFDVERGQTVGVVGETGCGKSSLARAIVRMERPSAGRVRLLGRDLVTAEGRELDQARRHIQMVFQDPYSSFDPRWRALDLVAEPLTLHEVGTKPERRERAAHLLQQVGLDPERLGTRRPGELSGGECQRLAIARALALNPELIVLDESVSSLDVSVQAQVLNLLESLRAELGLSYIFIGHDLRVVRHVSDRIAVMYLGKFCEVGESDAVYGQPHHPYTAKLLAAVPQSGQAPEVDAGGRASEQGELPSPLTPPTGCRFHTRCPFAQDRCRREEPVMRELSPGRAVACHFPLDAAAA